MGAWEFFRIPGAGPDAPPFLWAWQCRREDGTVYSTGETFRFLLDCIAHARLHGYTGGPVLTRREAGYTIDRHVPPPAARQEAASHR